MSHTSSQPPAGLGAGEPPAPTLPEIRASLDRALVGLRAIEDGALPLVDAERALGSALGHVYAALASRDDHATFREETHAALDDVRATLGALMAAPSEDAAAVEVAGLVAKSLGELQHVRWTLIDGTHLPRERDAVPYLRASLEVPRLLELRRHVLRPAVPLDERAPTVEEPPPDVIPAPAASLEAILALAEAHQEKLGVFAAASDDEDDEAKDDAADEAPRARAEPLTTDDELLRTRFGVAIGDRELLAERARDCMDDLATLGRMRRCTDPERWASGEETERRMLTKLDAIAACGVDVFDELVRLLDDRPIPDPELTFGNLFFFLSIAGDDAFDQAVRVLETADLSEPGMLEMCVDALVLAPHPRIDAALARWTRRPEADWRALAVEALRRRRTMSVALFDLLGGDSDPRVLASLARSMPWLPGGPPPGALGWFLSRPEEDVVRGALEASMFLRQPIGLDRAVEITSRGDGSWADSVMFVAIAGGREARVVLEDDIASAGSATALRALGWYGDATFVPFLLGRLRHGDDAAKAAALDALERLSGASILDASLVPEYRPKDEPFTRARRAYEPPGLLDGTPDAWDAWWKAWGRAAEPETRYRWGHAFSLADGVHELTHEGFVQRDRPFAAMELVVRGRAPVTLDWNDLVVRQRRHLQGIAGGAALVEPAGWRTSMGGPR